MKTIAIWGSVALLLILLMAEVVCLLRLLLCLILFSGLAVFLPEWLNCTITDSMVVCN